VISSYILKVILAPLFTTFLLLFNTALASEIAITVDDLPAHEIKPKSVTRMEIASKTIDVFRKHMIHDVYGFMNGYMLEYDSELIEVLQAWLQNGFELGNHTYSHISLAKNTASSFSNDITRNEKLLKQLNKKGDYRFFRYPYLYEGETLKKRDSIRKFLKMKGYKIAQVTMDFEDWAWNAPYTRCLEKKDNKSIEWMKKSYLNSALDQIQYSQVLSKRLFGRDIKHILLLHIGVFTAEMLDDLLQLLEKNETNFISLQKASNDPIYKINPNIPYGEESLPFLVQLARSKGLNFSKPPKTPKAKLQRLCLN
jgi:peptidoglycan/xylan/chitin deacetylase (PgdA/CDA1 family)